jgi:hypothetical protein
VFADCTAQHRSQPGDTGSQPSAIDHVLSVQEIPLPALTGHAPR